MKYLIVRLEVEDNEEEALAADLNVQSDNVEDITITTVDGTAYVVGVEEVERGPFNNEVEQAPKRSVWIAVATPHVGDMAQHINNPNLDARRVEGVNLSGFRVLLHMVGWVDLRNYTYTRLEE